MIANWHELVHFDMLWSPGLGVSKAGQKQEVADPRGSRTCVCANTYLVREWHTQEGKGEKHVLPLYRLVGVGSTSSETQGGKAGMPARVSGHLSWNAPR